MDVAMYRPLDDAASELAADRPIAGAGSFVWAKDVSLRFDNGVQALSGVSFHAHEGEFVSLIGPSGCGKTTLLNLFAGLLAHTGTGELAVNGRQPALGNPDVGYMLARDSLMPWRTALGNACFGLEVRGAPKAECEAKARAMLAAVGLSSFEGTYPKALSHGMRQRVALARTFAMDSKLLLMDEPFGALDAQTKLHLEDLLLQLCHRFRHTVVFVTHDLHEAVALSDRVVVMSSRPGRIVADVRIDLPKPRSIRELQKSDAFHRLYRELWTYLENGWTQHET